VNLRFAGVLAFTVLVALSVCALSKPQAGDASHGWSDLRVTVIPDKSASFCMKRYIRESNSRTWELRLTVFLNLHWTAQMISPAPQ